MRQRGIRVFTLVAVIVALSIATIAVRNFDVGLGDASVNAQGDGPLGLTLGLDLQGGSHLEYQTDLPDDVRVTFQDPVEEAELRVLLEDLGHVDPVISKTDFIIEDQTLEERALAELRAELELLLPIVSLATGDDGVEVSFQETTGDQLVLLRQNIRSVLDNLGYSDPVLVTTSALGAFSIQGISLEDRALERLILNLETVLVPIEAFESGDGSVRVTFREAQDEEQVRFALVAAGYAAATIENPNQREYIITELELDDTLAEELRTALAELGPLVEAGGFVANIVEPSRDQMTGVENIIRKRVNALGTTEPLIQRLGDDRIVVQLPGAGGTTVEATFPAPTQAIAQIGSFLEALLNTGATAQQTGLNTYILTTGATLATGDRVVLEGLAGTLAPGAEFQFDGDDDGTEITITLPSQPGESTIASLLAGLGFTDFSVDRTVSDRLITFTIRTEDVLITVDKDRLRETLESEIGTLVSFDARGSIEEAKELIGGTAQLVFIERTCLASLEELRGAALTGLSDPCDPVEQGGGGRLRDTVIDGLTGEELDRAFASRDPAGFNELSLEFNSRGREVFSDLTRRLAGDDLKRLAIKLDDEEIFAATVQSHITDGRTRITRPGGFPREVVLNMVRQLESGRLDVPLTLTREFTVDAILGADSLRKSLIAGLVGLALVLLFMVLYYRMAGLVAGVALLIYGVIVLAIFKLVPVTLTLSGIAGVILSIGMAVDANILIFERMKEEMRTGRSLASSMEVGFRRAWVAIRDGNVSTIITCAILFLFGSRLGGGTPVVTGFAVTLLIGVSVSMFTAITVSRNLLQTVGLTPAGKRLSLFTPEPPRQPVGVAGAQTGR